MKDFEYAINVHILGSINFLINLHGSMMDYNFFNDEQIFYTTSTSGRFFVYFPHHLVPLENSAIFRGKNGTKLIDPFEDDVFAGVVSRQEPVLRRAVDPAVRRSGIVVAT
jgi:hypothetical protein